MEAQRRWTPAQEMRGKAPGYISSSSSRHDPILRKGKECAKYLRKSQAASNLEKGKECAKHLRKSGATSNLEKGRDGAKHLRRS